MRVEDLYYEIADGLDFSGEIVSIDVINGTDGKPRTVKIRATCPNYPEQSCGYYEIKLSDYDNKEHECYCDLVKNSCCVNDLKSFANYEASLDTPINELSEFLREGDYND